ncbi:MAG: B12-binding domain-containing radical SAM protein [Candidatus Hodarchaeota archaeon]
MGFKVLLIAPPYYCDDVIRGGIKAESASPPLGLLYIAAMLRKNDYDVKLIDMNCDQIQNIKQLQGILKDYNPDLIGLATLTHQFKIVVDFANFCKEILPSCPITLGGYFATFNHDRILTKYDVFDFVVRGEGEETALELVMILEKQSYDFTKIKGLSFKVKGQVIINPPRLPIKDLDSLPFPAYELVSHVNYGALGGLRVSKKNLMNIQTSRGCPFRCNYCAMSAFAKHTMRWRSPENVVEELRFFEEKFGLNEYMFVDDNFTFSKKRVIRICRLIRENGLDIQWATEGRVSPADENMFREMARSGCKLIFFGLESCVDRILRYYRKGTTYQMIRNAIQNARKANIGIVGNFIIGAPNETVAEMWETVRLAAKLDIDYARIFPLQIFRGTPLWSELVQQGIIDDEKRWEETICGFEINPQVTMEEGTELLRQLQKAFFFRASYMLKQIFRWLVYRRKQILLNLKNIRTGIHYLRNLIPSS